MVRYEHNGTVTVLADQFEGKQLNSPNDAVVHPNDGSIWFTDPGYGSLMEYEGNRLPQSASNVSPFQKEAIYRIDGQSGAITKVADQPFKPNGLCFSHDYRRLFVADTGVSHYPAAKSIIWVYDIDDGTTLNNPSTFASMELDGKTGFADGHPVRRGRQRLGRHGLGRRRLRRGARLRPGWRPHRPDPAAGDLLQRLLRRSKRNRLFMTASQSLYAVFVETRGAHIT